MNADLAAGRADLRAGRREATSFSVQGGVEFGPGFRAGIDVEGTTEAAFSRVGLLTLLVLPGTTQLFVLLAMVYTMRETWDNGLPPAGAPIQPSEVSS